MTVTPRELAQSYQEMEERVAAFLPPGAAAASETFCDEKDLRRFFRRLGLLPRGKAGPGAGETLLAVVESISEKTGADRDRAKTVLGAYCRSDGAVAAAVCGTVPRCAECSLAAGCAFFSRRPTIKQMPETERPRERLVQLGREHLTDAELLAIIVGGGTAEQSAVDVARTLLTRFGGLRELAECSTAELRRVRGIGLARSAAIGAVFEIARRHAAQPRAPKGEAYSNPEAVFQRYRSTLGTEKRETFLVLLLDAKNRLLRDVTISQGSLTQSVVHPREAFEPAIRHSAASVIFVHNHPSGDTTPSAEDMQVTKQLRQTGEVIGIRVLDHVIVSETGFTSLAGERLL